MSERTWGPSDHPFFAAILKAANTDHFVRWDQVAKLPQRGITDRQRCEILLAVANGEPVTFARWNQLVGAEVVKNADNHTFVLPDADRMSLRHTLDEIVDGGTRVIGQLAEQMAEVASRSVVVVPHWTATQGRTDRLIARNLGAAMAYTLWLLLDSRRPYGADLCKCRYSECGRYFFKIRGRGAPVRKYCSPDHAVLGDSEAAAKRMRRLRR